MNEGYYVDLEGQTAGPFTIGEMRNLYLGRSINEQTLYARQGSVSWMPVATIIPLFATAPQAAPPPLPKAKPQAVAGDVLCRTCGHVGAPETKTPGSILIELLLWLCFLVPGLIYSIWRHTARHKVCRSCRHPGVIPANSPAAQGAVEYDPSVMRQGWIGIAVLAVFVWLVIYYVSALL